MANRGKSQWLFLSIVAERNPDIKILGKYIDCKTKIDVECKICGMKYQDTPGNILMGKLHKKGLEGKNNGCCRAKHWYHNNKRQDDIINKLKYIDNLETNLNFIETFNPETLLIKCKCKKCNTIHYIDIDTLFLSDCACPQCIKNIKDCKKRTAVIDKIFNNSKTIILISKNKSLLECKCSVCSNTFTINGYMNRKKIVCPFCEKKRRNEIRKNRRFEEKNGEYTAIKRKCEKSNLCIITGKYICAKDNGNYTYDNPPKECLYLLEPYYKKNEYKKLIEDNNHSIEVIGEYVDSITKIKYRCKNCGKEYLAKPLDLYQHKCGCKECHQSKGEIEIRSYLNEHNIKYEIEKTFDDCKNIRPLRFDFFIKDKNTVIEYDGKQHYEPIDYFGGNNTYDIQRQNDEIKNKYCKEKGIRIIRIPYFCNDIYGILDKKLIK